MKRSYPSGSQKRKIKKAKSEEAKLLAGSLSKYLLTTSEQTNQSNLAATEVIEYLGVAECSNTTIEHEDNCEHSCSSEKAETVDEYNSMHSDDVY